MRIIYNDELSPNDGNGGFTLSPEINKFLILPKGTNCRGIFYRDDGAWRLKSKIEKEGIELKPEDLKSDDRFWKNHGLFVKVIFKDSSWICSKYPSDQVRHEVFDIYRSNNGYYRLVKFENYEEELGYNIKDDAAKLHKEIDDYEQYFSQEDLGWLWDMSEWDFYDKW